MTKKKSKPNSNTASKEAVSARWKKTVVEMGSASAAAAVAATVAADKVVVEVEVVEVDDSTGAPVVTEVLGSRAGGGDGEAGDWGFFSPVEVMVVIVVDGVVVVVVVVVHAGAAVGADVVLRSVTAAGLVLDAVVETLASIDPCCDKDSVVLVGTTGTAGLEVTEAVVVLDLLLASSEMGSPV